ncbi:MAG: hypothetical protein H6538_07890 [Bacteroidales bacterium]|nr:hypothetical protein [Bacteroidales bacterium]
MKTTMIFLASLFMGLAFTTVSFEVKAQETGKKMVTEQQLTKNYTCPMHPEVIMDKPGKCPKCGMNMVEKTDKVQGEMHNMNDSCMMKHEHMKMMHDTDNMKNHDMKNDTASMKHNHGCM